MFYDGNLLFEFGAAWKISQRYFLRSIYYSFIFFEFYAFEWIFIACQLCKVSPLLFNKNNNQKELVDIDLHTFARNTNSLRCKSGVNALICLCPCGTFKNPWQYFYTKFIVCFLLILCLHSFNCEFAYRRQLSAFKESRCSGDVFARVWFLKSWRVPVKLWSQMNSPFLQSTGMFLCGFEGNK